MGHGRHCDTWPADVWMSILCSTSTGKGSRYSVLSIQLCDRSRDQRSDGYPVAGQYRHLFELVNLVDEAHNLESCCAEAGSAVCGVDELHLASADLNSMWFVCVTQ